MRLLKEFLAAARRCFPRRAYGKWVKGEGYQASLHYFRLHLDPDEIVVKEQERKTFILETIKELAISISTHGQIHECLVNYVDGVIVLIAGERRLRAVKYINENGMPHSRRSWKKKQLVEVRVFCSISTFESFTLQVNENIKEDVPPEQEAQAVYNLLKLKKSLPELQDLSLKDFCSTIGKSETSVYKAIRYIENLHPIIRLAVRTPEKDEQSKEKSERTGINDGGRACISYTVACEIARPHSQEEQLMVFKDLMSRKVRSLAVVKSCMKTYIIRQKGQTEIIDFCLTAECETDLYVRNILDDLVNHYAPAMALFRNVLNLVEQGILPEGVRRKVTPYFEQALSLNGQLSELEAFVKNAV